MHSQPRYLFLTSASLIITSKAVVFKSVSIHWMPAATNALLQTRTHILLGGILVSLLWKTVWQDQLIYTAFHPEIPLLREYDTCLWLKTWKWRKIQTRECK